HPAGLEYHVVMFGELLTIDMVQEVRKGFREFDKQYAFFQLSVSAFHGLLQNKRTTEDIGQFLFPRQRFFLEAVGEDTGQVAADKRGCQSVVICPMRRHQKAVGQAAVNHCDDKESDQKKPAGGGYQDACLYILDAKRNT